MELCERDWKEVCRNIAEILVEKNKVEMDDLVILPVATVAQFVGLTPAQVVRKFPVTEIGERTRGVRLSTYRQYLNDRTTFDGKPVSRMDRPPAKP